MSEWKRQIERDWWLCLVNSAPTNGTGVLRTCTGSGIEQMSRSYIETWLPQAEGVHGCEGASRSFQYRSIMNMWCETGELAQPTQGSLHSKHEVKIGYPFAKSVILITSLYTGNWLQHHNSTDICIIWINK